MNGKRTGAAGHGGIDRELRQVDVERLASHALASSSNGSQPDGYHAHANGSGSNGTSLSYTTAEGMAASRSLPPVQLAAEELVAEPAVRTISLYAGVGLVGGSEADSEWQVNR